MYCPMAYSEHFESFTVHGIIFSLRTATDTHFYYSDLCVGRVVSTTASFSLTTDVHTPHPGLKLT